MEKYCKTHTVKNIPSSQSPIKMILEKAFSNLSSKLCLTFYTTYSSERGDRARSPNANGLFKYLQQYCAAAFSPDSTTIETLQKDYHRGGVFVYTEIERFMIGKVNFRGRSLGEKYLDMVAYLFKIAYDVSLSPRNNVSNSPGFEGCGLFGG